MQVVREAPLKERLEEEEEGRREDEDVLMLLMLLMQEVWSGKGKTTALILELMS